MRSRRTAPGAEDSSDIIIPVGDAYYSMIGNSVIDYTEFGDEDAGEAEQEVYGIFMEKRASVCEDIMEQLSDSDAASNDSLTDEMQDYMDYVCDTVLTENTGILDSGAVDYSDDTYTEWSQGNISLYAYLNYAISRNWINTVNLSGSSYSSSAETYQAILDYVEEYIESDSGLTVLLYMADGTQLGFVGNVDLYTMFGNALDNAVESVVKQENVQKRVIQVSVFHEKNLQMIRVRNYCDEKPVFSDGLPVSTKKDRRYHGYGLKSIRYTAEKYGGGIVCQAADNYFVLQILLPIPESVRE